MEEEKEAGIIPTGEFSKSEIVKESTFNKKYFEKEMSMESLPQEKIDVD